MKLALLNYPKVWKSKTALNTTSWLGVGGTGRRHSVPVGYPPHVVFQRKCASETWMALSAQLLVRRQSYGHSVLVMYSSVSTQGVLTRPSEKSPEKECYTNKGPFSVALREQASAPMLPWFFSWLFFSPTIKCKCWMTHEREPKRK